MKVILLTLCVLITFITSVNAGTIYYCVDRDGNIQLPVRIAPDIGTITSDKRCVEQILLNLLSNALKFTDQGEILVTCDQGSSDYHKRYRDRHKKKIWISCSNPLSR